MTCTDSCGSVKIEYLGDGSQTLFTFPFTYIKQADVYVELYDEETRDWSKTEDWTWANATTIEFNTAPPAPENTDLTETIRISRCTDIDPLIATFNPGSAIRARDLNDNFEQLQSAILENRCELEESLGNPDDVITRPDQEAGDWVDFNDDKLATSDAIVARHDVHVQETLPEEPEVEQPGKGWQNTDDCWSSYWNPQSETWVAYVNTGPRGVPGRDGTDGADGPQGPQGPPGEKGDGIQVDGFINVPGPPAETCDTEGKLIIDSNGVGWFCDGNGTWIEGGPIQGPPGADGAPGPQGPDGINATIAVGNTTTTEPGTDANVINTGTSGAAVFEFFIPRGEPGKDGAGNYVFEDPIVLDETDPDAPKVTFDISVLDPLP